MKTVFEKATPVLAGGEFTYSESATGARFTVRGPGEVYIRAREFGERRVATVQRRARGVGDPTKASCAMGIFPRHFQKGPLVYGRRTGDREAHQERRVHIISTTGLNNLWRLGVARRKTDERRHTTVKEKILAGIFGCDVPRRRKGEDRRTGAPWCYGPKTAPRRRKGEDRRMMQRRALTVMFLLGGKRKATADRRAGPQGERYKLPADVERRSPGQSPGCSSKNNILGRWYGRRKGDERRDPHMKGVHYTSSRDPRIVALERRGKTLTFRRYTGIDGKDKT